MSTLSAFAAIIVGAVFVVAGASKIAAGPGWPTQAAGLGVRGALVPLVPWAEMFVGSMTAVGVFAPWPAVAAAAMLVVFTALISRLLMLGEHPPCACFGAWSASKIGPTHLARNAVLLALAVLAIA